MTNGTIEAFDTFLCVLRGLIDIANLRDPGYAIVPTIDALRDHLREELSSNALDAEGIVQFTSKELARDALLTALQDKELAREGPP